MSSFEKLIKSMKESQQKKQQSARQENTSKTAMAEKYYKLDKFRCPAEGCKNTESHSWVCGKDKTATYISQKGNIRCSTLFDQHKGPLHTWRWDCGKHGELQWRSADFQGYTWALSAAVQLMGKAGAAWVGELCGAIEEQFPKPANPDSD